MNTMFSLFRKRGEDTAEVPAATDAAPVDRPAPATPEPSSPSPEPAHAPAPDASTASSDPGFDFGALTAARPASEPTSENRSSVQTGPEDTARTAELTPPIVEALRTVFDPEIPINIYDLGLIYGISIDAKSQATITMTLTSPACPSAQQLPVEVEWKVREVSGVDQARVEVVWDPPWSKEKMSEEARLALGVF